MVYVIRDSFISPQMADSLAVESATVDEVEVLRSVDAFRQLRLWVRATILVGSEEAQKNFRERFKLASVILYIRTS